MVAAIDNDEPVGRIDHRLRIKELLVENAAFANEARAGVDGRATNDAGVARAIAHHQRAGVIEANTGRPRESNIAEPGERRPLPRRAAHEHHASNGIGDGDATVAGDGEFLGSASTDGK